MRIHLLSPDFKTISIAKQEVHLWIADTRDWQAGEFASLLSDEERARANRLRNAEHQSRAVIQRGLLRVLLGRYLDIAPEHISLQTSGTGRPSLADSMPSSDIDFNVSHSAHLCAYVISSGRVVGVDIEVPTREIDAIGIARRYFSSASIKLLECTTEAHHQKKFFELWTAHEACLKATGEGIANGLEGFQLQFDAQSVATASAGHAASCSIAMVNEIPAAFAAIAVIGEWDRAFKLFWLKK